MNLLNHPEFSFSTFFIRKVEFDLKSLLLIIDNQSKLCHACFRSYKPFTKSPQTILY